MMSRNKLRKICVITGTRAEYGLLYWLMKEISAAPDLELQVVVTGMHLSPEFGLTWKLIKADGFLINHKVEMLLSSDTPTGITKSMGIGMIGFAQVFEDLNPDIIVLLGDRFEIFSAAGAAMIARIPIAHIHGGESTEGVVDEAIRHSITKMAHMHFTATDEYRSRVIQLGEQPEHVYNVGAPGIDNIKRLKLLGREAFQNAIGFRLGKRNLLVTYHPVTLEDATAETQFKCLLEVLDELEETHLIFTSPNADVDGRIIMKLIDGFVAKQPDTRVAFTSLGQLRYLSAMQYVDAVVGNSSSGIIEAPSFRTGTVNIGDRQSGRIKSVSVIDCSPTKKTIRDAINELYSASFQRKLLESRNPYGEGGTAEKILKILEETNLTGILKKKFYDIR
jgi:GDP/UDP-N,N'-diacetylbacillosamine 2-epimerase (hydrolysing)